MFNSVKYFSWALNKWLNLRYSSVCRKCWLNEMQTVHSWQDGQCQSSLIGEIQVKALAKFIFFSFSVFYYHWKFFTSSKTCSASKITFISNMKQKVLLIERIHRQILIFANFACKSFVKVKQTKYCQIILFMDCTSKVPIAPKLIYFALLQLMAPSLYCLKYFAFTFNLLFQQMASVKKTIHPHTRLLDFIKTYPDQQLQQGLKLLQQSFPVHIAIKGDGNCFYRAFAFLYLSSNQQNDYNKVFPKTIWVCRNSNRVHSNQQFQDQLFQMWEQYVKNVSQIKNRMEKEKKMLAIFNSIPIFDELVISYFRSRTYHHVVKNKQELSPFSQNQPQFAQILDRIATLGNESEGTQINSLADAMKTRIMIFCINQNGFYPIEAGQNYEDRGFYLFFRPGHYDIVCPSLQTLQNQEQVSEQPLDSWLKLTKKLNSLNQYSNARSKENEETPSEDVHTLKLQQRDSAQMRSTFSFSTKRETAAQSKFDRRYSSNYQKVSSESTKKRPYKLELPSWETFYEKIQIEALGALVILLTGYFLYSHAA